MSLIMFQTRSSKLAFDQSCPPQTNEMAAFVGVIPNRFDVHDEAQSFLRPRYFLVWTQAFSEFSEELVRQLAPREPTRFHNSNS